jgi:hypothetical protein
MKMACLGGHFPILISKNTREDHERCIAFSWNPNGFFLQTMDKFHQDDNGQQPLNKSKLKVFHEKEKLR